MELRKDQYEQIKECIPKQRKPAKISNLDVLNAVLYIVENGCKWRGLPKEYGDWHVIYVGVNRWAKKGVLHAAFLRLQQLGIIQIQVLVISQSIRQNKIAKILGTMIRNCTNSAIRPSGFFAVFSHIMISLMLSF